MRDLTKHLAVLLILVMGGIPSFAAIQEENDEIEALKHAASVIRMLTAYDREEEIYSPSDRERLDAIISALRDDEISQAEELFAALLDEHKTNGTIREKQAVELNILFRSAFREAFSRDVEGLRYVADKVRYFGDAIHIAERYISELEQYRQKAGEDEIAITTTAIKSRYAYGESPESIGSIRRLSAAGIDAEIERVKRQITDMDKQVEGAAMQFQFATRRQIRIINRIVNAHDQMHAVLIRCIESTGGEQH